MHLVLIIAAGILLAFILLPFLGPIVMAVIGIAVFAWLFYCLAASIPLIIHSIRTIISVGAVGADAAQEVKKNAAEKAMQRQLFKSIVKSAPEFKHGFAAIDELLTLQGFRRKPVGLWYSYILHDRFRNCYMTGIFRVEDKLNRTHLEKYLEKTINGGSDSTTAPRAEALCQKILDCYDRLCALYQKKK